MIKLAHGVFTWSGSERRSDRYGSFNLLAEPFEGAEVTEVTYDRELAKKLEDKRVRILVRVLATRKSKHIGDLFLGIKPSTPEVGEEVDLGVGIFHTEPCEYDSKVLSTFLVPGEPPSRDTFWFNPRKLYRLHDQTVDVFIEETTEEFTPAPNLKQETDEGLIASGDGSFQSKGVELSGRTRIKPRVEPIGDGMFVMTQPGAFKQGERVDFDQEGLPSRFDHLREDD